MLAGLGGESLTMDSNGGMMPNHSTKCGSGKDKRDGGVREVEGRIW